MRIIKVSQPSALPLDTAQVVDSYTTSTTDAYSANYVNELNTYSTTEKVCGTWTDGKPLYKKTIEYTPSSASDYHNHGIANVDKIVNAYGTFKRTGLSTFNNIPVNYTNWEVYLYDFTNTQFTLKFSNNQWGAGVEEVYITLEYTKTTD